MVTKAPHAAQAALKPALHTGLGGRGSAGGLMVSSKRTPAVCCAACTKRAAFVPLQAQWDAATVTPPLFYLGGGKTLETKDKL